MAQTGILTYIRDHAFGGFAYYRYFYRLFKHRDLRYVGKLTKEEREQVLNLFSGLVPTPANLMKEYFGLSPRKPGRYGLVRMVKMIRRYRRIF